MFCYVDRRNFTRALLLALALTIGFALLPRAVSAIAPDPVVAAWRAARARGMYHFASDVVQSTAPSATVANIGRSSREQRLHLEGQNDLRANSTEMQLWTSGGSVLQTDSAVAVRVLNGKAELRQGDGPWRDAPGITDAAAPQGDFMAYLAAVRDIQGHAPESRAGVVFTRYSFRVDGPAFAGYMRDQIAAAMRAQGQLPAGAQIEVPSYYAQMTGTGELWIDGAGLPLRQILNLSFPEQNHETFAAKITVDFSGYPPVEAGFGILAIDPTTMLPQFSGLALWLAFAVMLVRGWRSRRLFRALSWALLAALVIGPLLTSAQAQAAQATQADQIAQARQDQQAHQAARAAQTSQEQRFDPHANPLGAAGAPSTPAQAASAPALSLAASAALSVPAIVCTQRVSPFDCDGDGLTDAQEQAIGTDPTQADTDGDTITDTLEIAGTLYANQHWYANPLDVDTNHDGRPDGQEWYADANHDGQIDTLDGQPYTGANIPTMRDTEGDGVPDMFDDDDDNDGVPDRLDLAVGESTGKPGTAATSDFSSTSVFSITVEHVAAEQALFVDFQLRPRNPDHLWFAYNVLDWPTDKQGQIQDEDSHTFADLPRGAGDPQPAANDGYGDLKLVPMLEIRINGDPASLPAQSALTPYNIFTTTLTLDGTPRTAKIGTVAYVPLQIVSDTKTGARVAFSGRMLFQSNGAPIHADEVRLVWLAQALVDICQTTKNGLCDSYRAHNQSQVIQTYYDSWYLTGLNAMEDHGARSAIIYEDPDPAVDTNLKDDGALWLLAHGLDNSFVAGRSQPGASQRDLTLNDIKARFDHASNSGVSDQARWGIPNVLSVANVVGASDATLFPTLDQAVTTTISSTKGILSHFENAWQSDHSIKPLLMFASEASYRAVGLDGLGAGHVALNGNRLSIDFGAAQGGTPVSLDTQAGLKWTPYCAGDTVAPPDWQPCAPDVYWNVLSDRYAAGAGQPSDTGDKEAIAYGRLVAAQLYFLSLAQGVNTIVQRDDRPVALDYTPLSDAQLANANTNTIQLAPSQIPTTLAASEVSGRYQDTSNILAFLGFTAKDLLQEHIPRATVAIGRIFAQSRLKGTALAVGLVLGVAALTAGIALLSAYNLAGSPHVQFAINLTLKSVVAALTIYYGLVQPLRAAIEWVQVVKAAGYTTLEAIRIVSAADSAALGASRASGIVGAAIAIGITWGFFIFNVVSNQIVAGSPAFNSALAEAIAATILIVVLTVLSFTVVGLIIVAIIAVIDIILTIICEAGVDELKNAPGLGGACFTLGGAATKFIAKVLYSFDSMVDTEHKDPVSGKSDLVVTGQIGTNLHNKLAGYVTGNPIDITLPVTTTIQHKSPVPENWNHILPYLWLFSPSNLRSSTFQYSLTSTQQEIKVERDQMPAGAGGWGEVTNGPKFAATQLWRTQARSDPSLNNLPLPAPGLNRPLGLYLNLGYAVPAYECWMTPVLFPLVPVCYTRTVDGSSSEAIDQLRYDILPDTLDGFMTLAKQGNGGQALAWDSAFPALHDADNDGVPSRAYNGIDPNDASWDSDGDGLSDRFESDQRAAGVGYSLAAWDTDLDGLTDQQEAVLGTNPAVADTDNDGIKDGDEAYHEVFTIDGSTGRIRPKLDQGNPVWSGGWDVTIPADNGKPALVVHVSSDPSFADSDGDGVGDQAERYFAQQPAPKPGAPDLRLDRDGRPYLPLVANTPPIAIYPSIDDADGVVRPGQTLAYTSTVVTNTPLAPSVLDITLPASFGASPPPYRLDFDPNTFTTAQTVTQRLDLTAPQLGSQTAAINSTVRGRLPAALNPGWKWDPSVPGVFRDDPVFSKRAPRFTDIAPSAADRQDSYRLATLDSDNAARKGFGDVRNYTIDSTQPINLESEPDANKTPFPPYKRGNTAPQIACVTSGRCLTVWDRYNDTTKLQIDDLRFSAAEDRFGGVEPVMEISQQGSTTQISLQCFDKDNRPINRFPLDIGTSDRCQSARPIDVNGNTKILLGEVDDMTDWLGGADASVAASVPGTATKAFDTHTRDDCSGPLEPPIQCHLKGAYRFSVLPHHIDDVAGSLGDGRVFSLTTASDASTSDYAPVVASDGANFLVAWVRHKADGSLVIILRAFDAGGAQVAQEGEIPLVGANAASGAPYASLSLVRAGDAYQLAWKAFGSSIIHVQQFGISGQAIVPALDQSLAFDAATAVASAPQQAYDPVTGRTLLAYAAAAGQTIQAKLYQSNGVATGAAIARDGGSPRVAYHPPSHGWLLGWTDANGEFSYEALSSDLTTLPGTLRQSLAWLLPSNSPASVSLACPAPSSAPVADLRFEELPGATTFADASGFNNSATAASPATSPSAGVPGAPNAPLSDFAVRFDGVDDYATIPFQLPDAFSIAFWLKTTQTDGFYVFDSLVTGGGTAVAVIGDSVILVGPQAAASNSVHIADGAWHFVVATRAADGSLQVYVDGQAGMAGSGPAQPLNAAADIRIGGLRSGAGALRGDLDQFSVYRTALDATTVQTLYNRSQASFCLASAAATDGIPFARLPLAQDTPLRAIAATAGLTVTIDGILPTSSISLTVDPLTHSAFLRGPGGDTPIVTIGGNAEDNTGVARVEVNVDNAGWQPTGGAATWAFNFPATAGTHTIQTRATDIVGNVETPGQPLTVLVDSAPPQLAFAVPAAPSVPSRDAVGSWRLHLAGTISDPAPSSGVISTTVLLQSHDPNVPSGGWQAASRQASDWAIDYTLPGGIPDPSGTYSVTVRAVDTVGNATGDRVLTGALQLDNAAPVAALSLRDSTTAIYTQTATLTGLLTDTHGVSGLDVAFVPIKQVVALSGTVLLLPFDERPGAVWFDDRSTQRSQAVCASAPSCPAAGVAGRIDSAIQLDGQAVLTVPDAAALNFGAADSFSVQAWIKPALGVGGEQPVAVKWDPQSGQGYRLTLQDGIAAFTLSDGAARGGADLRDDQWHQLVGVVDRAAGQALLYVDGALVNSAPVTAGAAGAGDLTIGGWGAQRYTGAIDQVAVWKRALISEEVQSLLRNADLAWQPATVTPTSTGAGWSVGIPDGVEDEFQIDLRAADTLGNRDLTPNVWHGIIDTLAPRVTIVATLTGQQFFDPAQNVTRYEIAYACAALDRNLSGASFGCAGNTYQPPERSFDDDPSLRGLFPDLTVRSGLSMAFFRWEPSATPGAQARACDIYGHCASASSQPTTAGARALSTQAVAAPRAMIVAPTQTQVVSSTGSIDVTIAAAAPQALRELTLALDGQVVATGAFSQSAALANLVRVARVTPNGEGLHTLTAQATDWSGAQSAPDLITFTLDLNRPEIELSKTVLERGDIYQLGSGIMRFSGVATDTVGLAAVQLRVGDGPFEDATLHDDGRWSTARSLGDATYGQNYRVTVRAIDRASQINDLTQVVLVNIDDPAPLAPAALLETTITAGPGATSLSKLVSFSFTGSISPTAPLTFECRIDAGVFQPCVSPQRYTLDDGPYTFEVRAIDSAGHADPTPARYAVTIVTSCANAVPTITGTAGNDTIVGTLGTDIIFGLGGNDRIDGGGGNDLICGGEGDDRLTAGDGDDLLDGGSGNDKLDGGRGDDRLFGGPGANYLRGAEGNDLIVGGPDSDQVLASSGNDTVVGGAGADDISGGGGDDVLDGGDGNDRLDGGWGKDTLMGGAGDDRLDGGHRDDVLQGGDGNDILDGGEDNDTLQGGPGQDRLTGDDGTDTLHGDDGDDLLDGGDDPDVSQGGAGNDTLAGGAGNDTLDGGSDIDRLSGGGGDDTLTGGTGADHFDGGAGTDTATDFNASEGDRKSGVERGS